MTDTPKTDHPKYAIEAIPSDIKSGVFLGDPIVDNLVSCVIAMGTEMWATRRRLKVVEAVIAQHGISSDLVENYVPSAKETAAWEADRDRFIELTLGYLGNDGTRDMSAAFPKRS